MDCYDFQEDTLKGRYINYGMIAPLLENNQWEREDLLGYSVKGIPIKLYKIGSGKIKILAWSQMHGNESTTTKALFDLLNYLYKNGNELLQKIQFYFIPMLNPDGAEVYSRLNANGIDLNRDAFNRSQPETQCLYQAYKKVQPDFCFNLHDQRTIFNVGKTNKPATLSFLSPSYNLNKEINTTRKIAMSVIVGIHKKLQKYIPGQVGRFDDAFNLNCTGDYFTFLGTPTILFEAGHFPDDYNRKQTRKYMLIAILESIVYISKQILSFDLNYESYFQIPENNKMFYDIIIRKDVLYNQDIGILFEEKLFEKEVKFIPYIAEKGDLSDKYGHIELPFSEFMFDKLSFSKIENIVDIKEIKKLCVKI